MEKLLHLLINEIQPIFRELRSNLAIIRAASSRLHTLVYSRLTADVVINVAETFSSNNNTCRQFGNKNSEGKKKKISYICEK